MSDRDRWDDEQYGDAEPDPRFNPYRAGLKVNDRESRLIEAEEWSFDWFNERSDYRTLYRNREGALILRTWGASHGYDELTIPDEHQYVVALLRANGADIPEPDHAD